MNRNRFLALAMAGAMTLAAATPAFAEESADGTTKVRLAVKETTYDLVVPATLDVTSSGYNAFAEGVTVKNLTNGTGVISIDVTAASTNGWKLKDDTSSDEISYKLAANDAQDTEKTTYSFTDTTAMATTTGETVACGVNVSDYSSAAAGDYSDIITWTAKVKKTTTTEVTLYSGSSSEWWLSESGFRSGIYQSYTTDGVTYTPEGCDLYSDTGFLNGTFSTASGVITKIVIEATSSGGVSTAAAASGSWTTATAGGKTTATWEGVAATSVIFTGNFYGEPVKVVVTVES